MSMNIVIQFPCIYYCFQGQLYLCWIMFRQASRGRWESRWYCQPRLHEDGSPHPGVRSWRIHHRCQGWSCSRPFSQRRPCYPDWGHSIITQHDIWHGWDFHGFPLRPLCLVNLLRGGIKSIISHNKGRWWCAKRGNPYCKTKTGV